MARVLALATLLMVLAAVAVGQGDNSTNSDRTTESIIAPSKCPETLPDVACISEYSSCKSSEECEEGDDCCKGPCGYNCYSEERGFYRPKRTLCPPVPMVFCFRFDEQCSQEKPCEEGQTCCRSSCGTVCYSPDLE